MYAVVLTPWKAKALALDLPRPRLQLLTVLRHVAHDPVPGADHRCRCPLDIAARLCHPRTLPRSGALSLLMPLDCKHACSPP